MLMQYKTFLTNIIFGGIIQVNRYWMLNIAKSKNVSGYERSILCLFISIALSVEILLLLMM